MNLSEVISHSSYGKTDGDDDTIHLMSAPDFKSAFDAVWCNASPSNHGGKRFPLADVVHEIGIDSSRHAEADGTRIIRGPYIQYAYNYGRKSWGRKIVDSEKTNEWEETFPE
ncbi:MAG: hypothetical protein B7Z37_23725 [Verrucomicrobia bacterium 12-59-8]|nr:MAG: hypothetical protein B7Z37_23725 [Verrucomicrobia bacterium 12-59-8]